MYYAKQIVRNLKRVTFKNKIDLEKLFKKYSQDETEEKLYYKDMSYLLRRIDPKITDLECLYVYKYFDDDRDGSINIAEFVKVLVFNFHYLKNLHTEENDWNYVDLLEK